MERLAYAYGSVHRPGWDGYGHVVAYGPAGEIDVSVYMTSGTYSYIEEVGDYPSEYHQKALRWGHLTMNDPNGCLYSSDGTCTPGVD